MVSGGDNRILGIGWALLIRVSLRVRQTGKLNHITKRRMVRESTNQITVLMLIKLIVILVSNSNNSINHISDMCTYVYMGDCQNYGPFLGPLN